MLTNATQRSTVDLSTDESHTDFTNLRGLDLRPWENSDPFITAHTRHIVRTVLTCYVEQLILILGIPGNIICCFVFLKQGLLDRINLLLFSLAVADLINLVMLLLISLDCYIENWDKVQAKNWITIMNSNLVYLGLWASFVSGGLIMIMSVDRCLSVVMPLKAGRLLPYRSMLAAILVLCLAFLGFYLPIMLVNTVGWRVDPSTNRSIAFIETAEWFVLDSSLPRKIKTIIGTIFQPVFLVVVIICCSITIAKLQQASRKRLQMQETGTQKMGGGDNRINKMLLFLCVAYAVLLLPDIGTKITYWFEPEFYVFRKYHNSFVIVAAVKFAASSLNSTVNFFIYLVLSSRFRTTLRELCQHCGGKPYSWVRQRKETQTMEKTMTVPMDCQ